MKRRKKTIPDFKNFQEEAEFWDTHDMTDYMSDMKPIKVRFAKNLSDAITVRFDPVTLERLRGRAHASGIGPTTLIRMWVVEKLHTETGSQPQT